MLFDDDRQGIEKIVSSERIIYTPSSFARQSLFYLQETGSLLALKKHRNKRQKLNSFLFFVVKSGGGYFTYNGFETKLNPGDCVFVDCHTSYEHSTDEENLWMLQWCHFDGAGMGRIYQKYKERGGKPVFRPKDTTRFVNVLDEIYALASGSDYIRDMRINEKISVLLTYLMEESWNPEREKLHEKKGERLLPVLDFLDSNYSKKVSLDDLAERFYINKYYLVKSFKEQYGISICSYLKNVRITKSKHLLRFTKLSMDEISSQCGLGSGYYFSRVFKAVEGISPSEYRKKW